MRRKNKFKNVIVKYRFINRKTGRFVSKRFSKRYPGRVSRRRYFLDKETHRQIAKANISDNRKIQTLLQLSPGIEKVRVTKRGRVIRTRRRLTEKGAKKQLKALKEKAHSASLTAESPNYQRWFRALYEDAPHLLPGSIRSYVEREYPQDFVSEKLGLSI